MYFKLSICYAVVTFNHLQKECKTTNTKMTAKDYQKQFGLCITFTTKNNHTKS
ncbi:MAG TPA: hypothetical protein OIM45_07015 [Clostridiaceae bacterium]|nr:hypothetical protein [Clostridiaceae bacterium]